MSTNPTLKSRSLWQVTSQQFRRDKMAVLGTVVLSLIIITIIFGPVLYTTPFDQIDFSNALASPSFNHPFRHK
jgi:peptide/nickel transport system permease protein